MARKKNPKIETIQFRPDAQLSSLLDEFAGQVGLSRNEAARRLVHLGIRGLPIVIYPYLVELQALSFESPEFGDACHAFVATMNPTKSETKKSPPMRSVDDMVSAAQQQIEMLRFLRGLKNEAETVKVHVYVTRG